VKITDPRGRVNGGRTHIAPHISPSPARGAAGTSRGAYAVVVVTFELPGWPAGVAA
jgi:hypothetical protein